MKRKTVASRYAKALLLLGQSKNEVDVYTEELRTFLDALERAKEAKRFLLSPVFDASERKRIVSHMASQLKLSGIIKNFLQFLIDKERMGEVKDIFESYRDLADELNGRVRVQILSATRISPNLVAKIHEQMERMLKKAVILEIEIQPELIGGLVAKIKNVQIDGSVKNQIAKLREKLESAFAVA